MMHTYSFRLRGGSPIAMRLGIQNLEHNGSLSVWSVTLTEDEAINLRVALQTHGIQVSYWAPSLLSPDEQPERHALLQAQAGEVDYLTPQCPSCFWMDLLARERCGLQHWPKEMRDTSFHTHQRARKDAATCPLVEQAVKDSSG